MRDVNYFDDEGDIGERIAFYLNYEGCKRKLNYTARLLHSLFYLNYEGCKRSNQCGNYKQQCQVLSEL